MHLKELFDLSHTGAAALLLAHAYPWQALAELDEFILKGERSGYEQCGEGIWIHKTAKVAPTACINGPCVIGAGSEVRHCAFIRGRAFIGEGCVIGNSSELKNVILFDGVQVPHYNYVGDSILGYRAHMGAGAITSNVKSDKSPVAVHWGGECIATGMKKVGAMIGDHAEIGCGSVLNPGTVVGRGAVVYPLCSVRGEVAENSIYKGEGKVVLKRK